MFQRPARLTKTRTTTKTHLRISTYARAHEPRAPESRITCLFYRWFGVSICFARFSVRLLFVLKRFCFGFHCFQNLLSHSALDYQKLGLGLRVRGSVPNLTQPLLPEY